jgi:aspartyl-tRNA synthetase
MEQIVNALKKQMLAALSTLYQCIETCPKSEWDQSHNDAPFSQVAFHTLFCIDYHLSKNENEFKSQLFHEKNKNMFKDYEELEYKKAENLYTKDEIDNYMAFCYEKIENIYNTENIELNSTENPKNMSFIELSIYITRHIQHHAAQLGLRVQQITGKELKWISSGWNISA